MVPKHDVRSHSTSCQGRGLHLSLVSLSLPWAGNNYLSSDFSCSKDRPASANLEQTPEHTLLPHCTAVSGCHPSCCGPDAIFSMMSMVAAADSLLCLSVVRRAWIPMIERIRALLGDWQFLAFDQF